MRGLSSAEAAQRLRTVGYNEIPETRSHGLLRTVGKVVREPMLILLLACAFIYLAIGEPKDASVLLFSVLIVIGITLYQEGKSERAIEALRDLSSPRALVIRDGAETRIAGREVVPDDLVILNEGDRVPADAEVTETRHLKVDESLLTGESLSVTKAAGDRIFSGTLVVAGYAVARVFATGAATQMGRIGQALGPKGAAEDQTLLQREMASLIRAFAIMGLGASILIAVVYGVTRNDWPQGFLLGIAVAMSLLPEEFPVVMTIFLAMGAWRISKTNVLTRRMAATESLGSITTLCVDKTGTLTQNVMAVRSATDDRTLRLGRLASRPDPFDPMEKAIHKAAEAAPGAKPERLELVREYPLSHALLAMTCAWRETATGSGGPSAPGLLVACKGAPEAVLRLCRISREGRHEILARVQELAGQGLRVLAVAHGTAAESELPEDAAELELEYAGLIALEDPIRPEVPGALAECYRAGIRVIMMTGDFAGTAQSIASQIGLESEGGIITGEELRNMSDLELKERASRANIFARMVPEQKLRVVNALKSSGQIVAMTGDGVNDAPSLKWADVGIAMGRRGTDVAREAASIVLLDDNFASIVASIRMGRRVFENIRKAVAFIIAVHVPIAGMAILPVVLGLPLVLLPAHIVFLELVIDPACALIFEAEPEEPNTMSKPPRSLDKTLFGFGEIARDSAQGLFALVFVFSSYWIAGHWELGPETARTVGFCSLVLSNLGLILVNRSRAKGFIELVRAPNQAFWWIFAGTLALLGLSVYVPGMRELFGFAPLGAQAWGICLAAATLTVLGSRYAAGAGLRAR